LLIIVGGCVVSWTTMIVINKTTWNFFYSHCKEKQDEEVRLAKTKKMVDNCYRSFFFTVVSVWGYIIAI
jgi:hypothetical protein